MQDTVISKAPFMPYISVSERWLVLGLVCLFPVLMGTVGSAASTIFLLLSLLGLFALSHQWQQLFGWEKWILWGFLAFVAYNLISLGWTEDTENGWRRFEKVARFLLAVPLYLLVRRHADQAYKAMLYGFIVAGPVMVWVAHETMISGRAHGAYNHILYGDFTLMVCLSALSAALLAQRNRWVTVLLIVSAGFALYASLLTQTRGAWLVLPIAFLLFLWISIKRFSGAARRWVLGSLLAIATVGSVAVANTDIFQNRYALAVNSFQAYADGQLSGSVATRFGMWEAALEHWKVNPVFGTGLGDYWHDTKALAKENPYFRPIAQYSEAHSLYFEFLATSGLVGLTLLLWTVLLQPLWRFWQHIQEADNPIVQYLAFDGVLIIVAVMNDAVSQNWLSRNALTSAYIFFLVVFLTGIARLAKPLQR